MNNKNYELPLGLAMALSMNEIAMTAYSGMSQAQRQAVISKAAQATTKAEMQRIVQNIADRQYSTF